VNIMQFPGRLGPEALARKYLELLQGTAVQIEAALNASGHFGLGARPQLPAGKQARAPGGPATPI
jgi:hypothetical protein